MVIADDYGYMRWGEVGGKYMDLKRSKCDQIWDFREEEGKFRDMSEEGLWRGWGQNKKWIRTKMVRITSCLLWS